MRNKIAGIITLLLLAGCAAKGQDAQFAVQGSSTPSEPTTQEEAKASDQQTIPTVDSPRPVPLPQTLADRWTIEQGEMGRLNISTEWRFGIADKKLTMVVQGGKPISGNNHYLNDVVREMTPGELKYYWNFGGAKHAVEAKSK